MFVKHRVIFELAKLTMSKKLFVLLRTGRDRSAGTQVGISVLGVVLESARFELGRVVRRCLLGEMPQTVHRTI